MYINKEFTYLGIDETTLSLGNRGLIVVAAETRNKKLIQESSYELDKSRDILLRSRALYANGRIDPTAVSLFPSLDDMMQKGLEGFHWTRARGGRRFNRQEIEHASIAHVVASNGYNPDKTVLLIDNFYGNGEKTKFLIKEYLHARNFKIDRKNIECHEGGDKLIPLINYADLLAFQICMLINYRYKKYFPKSKKFNVKPQEIAYDKRRVMVPLDEEGRDTLEEVINGWKGK